MVKEATRADINTFIKGIITEASLLEFPIEAWRDGENFIPKLDGSNERRLGLDFEPNYLPLHLGYQPGLTVNAFRWNSVNGLNGQDFLALQIENRVSFFDLRVDNLSRQGLLYTLELEDFPLDVKYSFAAVDGKLVAVCGIPQVAVIQYSNSGTFDLTVERIKIRDFFGLQEPNDQYENDPQFRGPWDLYHLYNLRNQSWANPQRPRSGNIWDPAYNYYNTYGRLPSSADQVWNGLEWTASTATRDFTSNPFERFYPYLIDERTEGSTEVSKGHFVIDLLDRGQGRQEAYDAMFARYSTITQGAMEFPQDYTTGGSTELTEWAGRVFFSGFRGTLVGGDKRSPSLNNQVAFSQLINSEREVFRCYQAGDPTSRAEPDLVATDGGLIRISRADNIIALQGSEGYLAILASNGVWILLGGNNYGFDATNYKVQQLSTFGCIAPNSVVKEGSNLHYWADSGIYSITRDQFGDPTVVELSIGIKTLYEEIPKSVKESAIGEFDSFTHTVRWVYNVGTPFTEDSETYELVYNTELQAFYKNKITSIGGKVEIINMFTTPVFSSTLTNEFITVNGEDVTVDGELVYVSESTREYDLQELKYVTAVRDDVEDDYFIVFSHYYNGLFRDFQLYDGVGQDAAGYLITGPYTVSDVSVRKQVPYIVTFMKKTETGMGGEYPLNMSSCIFRSRWQWSTSNTSHKWSYPEQAYAHTKYNISVDGEYDVPYEVVQTKHKLKGTGRAFALEFRTEPDRDCKLIGWSLTVNGNPIT